MTSRTRNIQVWGVEIIARKRERVGTTLRAVQLARPWTMAPWPHKKAQLANDIRIGDIKVVLDRTERNEAAELHAR
jgi:hypothetical protein